MENQKQEERTVGMENQITVVADCRSGKLKTVLEKNSLQL